MILSWQRRRGVFNHDWLKNRYLSALAKFENLLNDYVEDDDFLEGFIEDVFPEWESYRSECLDLIENFEIEMSPRVLLEHEQFSCLDNEVRIWLRELVHNLWLTRYPVSQWMEEAFRCIKDVDYTYEEIIKVIRECPDQHSAAAFKPLKAVFEEYSNFCRKLAKTFEKFPNRILVT